MIENKIISSIKKFKLDLKGKIVLTEAATGNYVVTPVIAALSGATVFALTKNSKYGSTEYVRDQTYKLAKKAGVSSRINIINNIDDIDLEEIDILTNTGFLRPINRKKIKRLSPRCVIPLMWEPWEYRSADLDIEACLERGIKVYGTNESHKYLRTLEYIGYVTLYLLLDNKLSPKSSHILLIGCKRFVEPVSKILRLNNYTTSEITDYTRPASVDEADAIIVLEHERKNLIIGNTDAFIKVSSIRNDQMVIHICGNVSFKGAKFRYVPEKPKPFGYMSFTADYIDIQAVIDLHTAGLKVAEGMLKANKLFLSGKDYKVFMETNYPALSFDEPKFW